MHYTENVYRQTTVKTTDGHLVLVHKVYTTVNDLPNEFALARLGKNQKFCYTLTVSSYKTLVRRPNVIETFTCL